MTMLPRIGVIGFGNMGEALAVGLTKKHPGEPIAILESHSEARAKATKNRHIVIHESLESLVQACDVLVIAIKPQDIPNLTARLKPLAAGKGFISVAAGLTTAWFEDQLGTSQVVRFMPNLAAKVGKSLVGVSPGAACSAELTDQALAIAEAMGTATLIPEKLMSAITGLSGSGIAFVFRFAHALAMGGVREGFAYPLALEHALVTIEGAVNLLRATGEHPIAFESKVCSAAGTTVEGVKVLEKAGFVDTVIEAISAATRRAIELER